MEARERDPAYDRWLTSEFDAVAATYGEQVRGNPFEAYLRERSREYEQRHLADRHRLIELGCGTGIETLPLLSDGHEVLAVDVSERMLEELRTAARAAGRSEHLETRRLRLRDLPGLTVEEPFDGGLSTFGALNCEPLLGPVREGLYRLLRPTAPVVVGVFNRTSLFEISAYSLVGEWRRAFGRVRSPMPVGSSRFSVDCYPRSPAEVARAFRPGFVASDLAGLSIVMPPPDLADRLTGRFNAMRAARLDRELGASWPFRSLGDHFLMTLTRGAAEGAPGSGVGR